MNYIYLFNCPHTKCHRASCFGQAREYGRQSVRQLFGADAELSARVCCCRVVFSRAVCCCTAPGVECAPGGVDGLPCCQARVWAGLLHGIVGGGRLQQRRERLVLLSAAERPPVEAAAGSGGCCCTAVPVSTVCFTVAALLHTHRLCYMECCKPGPGKQDNVKWTTSQLSEISCCDTSLGCQLLSSAVI